MKFHKDNTLPQNGETFVFGSNLAGRHGAGAANIALKKFGAIYGEGIGKVGNSFAIPTKNHNLEVLPIETIEVYVGFFLWYAYCNQFEEYFLTSIGCGLAGYTPDQIAPMFKHASDNISFPDTWKDFL